MNCGHTPSTSSSLMIGTIGRLLKGNSWTIPFSSLRLLAGSKIINRPERAVPWWPEMIPTKRLLYLESGFMSNVLFGK